MQLLVIDSCHILMRASLASGQKDAFRPCFTCQCCICFVFGNQCAFLFYYFYYYLNLNLGKGLAFICLGVYVYVSEHMHALCAREMNSGCYGFYFYQK